MLKRRKLEEQEGPAPTAMPIKTGLAADKDDKKKEKKAGKCRALISCVELQPSLLSRMRVCWSKAVRLGMLDPLYQDIWVLQIRQPSNQTQQVVGQQLVP
jgi:hypothetical protein